MGRQNCAHRFLDLIFLHIVQVVWIVAFEASSDTTQDNIVYCFSLDLAADVHPADVTSWFCELLFISYHKLSSPASNLMFSPLLVYEVSLMIVPISQAAFSFCLPIIFSRPPSGEARNVIFSSSPRNILQSFEAPSPTVLHAPGLSGGTFLTLSTKISILS